MEEALLVILVEIKLLTLV
jgi:hypothetical protein